MKPNEDHTSAAKPRWQKPELVRLGTIRDIAQGPTPNDQANNNKRS